MSLEGSEAPRTARVSLLAWVFELRGRPTGGDLGPPAALVFLPRMFWSWFVGPRCLRFRPTGGALPGFFRGSYRRVCISLPAFLPPPGYRSWPAPVDPASQWSLQPSGD